MLRIATTIALLLASSTAMTVRAAEEPGDVWIFSGQSNMQKIGGPVRKTVGAVVEGRGHDYEPIYVAAPGKPIEAWLDPDHKDHRLWTDLVERIDEAKNAGHRFRGFIWYQGESNVGREPTQYQRKLTELVKRVRRRTDTPELPVIVVQIGAATSYDGMGWSVGIVREAQRRFVEADEYAALVTAIDAEIGDYTVHLSNAGAQIVADRVARAAERLAYGDAAAHWGPQLRGVTFADAERQHVIVEFDEVAEKLRLEEGGLAGFAASRTTRLPEDLATLKDISTLGPQRDDLVFPVGGRLLDEKRLLLVFDEPLPADACLNHAVTRNAQYGPSRRWRIEFGGLVDGTDTHPAAFALVPIGPPAKSFTLPEIVARPEVAKDWSQIAVNCVGRFPEAVLPPKSEAGVDTDEWRQRWWNPAAAGTVPNLFDHTGRVTGVHFHSGVWYMSPYFRELRNGDDALMASWCKNSSHAFSGLEPGRRYRLAVYLLQGPPKKIDDPPARRPVRVNVVGRSENEKLNRAEVVVSRVVDVPATASFDKFETVDGGNDERSGHLQGNVLLLTAPADERGMLELVVQVADRKSNGDLKWGDTTLAGVQIRPVD